MSFEKPNRVEDVEKAQVMAEAGHIDRSRAAENREIARGSGKLDNPEHDKMVTNALEKEAEQLDAKADKVEKAAGKSFDNDPSNWK